MKNHIRCLIIDDEPPAIRLLEKYIEKVSNLKLIGTTTDPLDGLRIIESSAIDLIFLDIQMPNLTGIQLSKIIDNQIKVIFTTAYPQFALESYDLNAVDYLLKPFEFERFYKAVKKVNISNSNDEYKEISPSNEFLFVKGNGKNNFTKIKTSDILYFEGLKNYVAIHLSENQIITYSTLKNIIDNLPDKDFIQIHKSFIVSLRHIERTTTNTVYINNKELPIGEKHKSNLTSALEQHKL